MQVIVLDKEQRWGKFQPNGDEYVLVGYSKEFKASILKTRNENHNQGTRCEIIWETWFNWHITRDFLTTSNDKEASTVDNSSNISLKPSDLQNGERQKEYKEEDGDSDLEESATEISP